MRKFFTLLLFFSISIMEALAAPPTVPASNFVFSGIQGGRISVRFTSGNGASRIVVMKAGSEITGLPVNGTQYDFNLAFGTANTSFINSGEYVVYRGTSNQFTVTNLQPATTYHLSVFEYNGAGALIEYLMIPLKGSETTVSAPTVQASAINFTNVIGNSLRINWTIGNGSSRLIIARKNNPVNVTPTDLIDYNTSLEFGSGAVLNGDNYVVYKNTGNNATLTKLDANTTYHFAIFEFNGSNTPVFLSPAATASFKTLAGPTIPANSISMSGREGNRLTFTVSGGNGSRKLFVMKKGSAVSGTPVNGTVYTANADFGSGSQLGTGEYVVSSVSPVVTVTNLEPSTTYHVRVFEYDVDAAGNTYYLSPASATNSYMTATQPSQVTGINFTNVSGSSITVRFTGGDGSFRMLIMREGSPVDAEPTDLIRYNGNSAFGQGAQIGTGNYVVQGGVNGTTINVTNLQPGKTYHLAMHEFLGNNYPVYARPAATASITIPNQPTTPSSTAYFNSVEGNSFRANWTGGDGARRIVIARKGAAVTATPVDNTTYTANNNFGEGYEIAPGQFVVYDGTHVNTEIKKLEINTTYHIAVFEYNSSASGPDYLVSAFLQGSGTTLTAPTVQSSNISTVNLQTTSTYIHFTPGNGTARIFVIRKDSPVDAEPIDLTSYNNSSTFGLGSEIGVGNFLVFKSASIQDFNIIGLQPNTTYHLAAYEYFGSTGPVFLRPGSTTSFTTLPLAGDNTPTIAATNGMFSETQGNKLRLDWTNGNGASRIVVARAGAPVAFTPSNGTAYSANASFAAGNDVGIGEYIVYNGSASSVTITNLQPSITYHFTIYEYNGTGAAISYQVNQALSVSAATLSAPATGTTLPLATNTASGLKIEWTPGSGSSRMVVVREGNAVSGSPLSLNAYPANASFGNGSQIAAGEYVVYAGSGNNVTVTGLVENKTYHFSIFEYNGTDGPVYNIDNVATGSALISSTLPVRWAYFTATPAPGKVILKWGTLQEENASHFTIERNEGNGFIAIGDVAAAGTTTVAQHYSFEDVSLTANNVTYRIRQVDIDGKASYSQIVHVRREQKSVLSVFPNPASSQVTVKFQGSDRAELLIIDAKGAVQQKMKIQNNQLVDVSRLVPGVYQFVVIEKNKRYSLPVIRL